MGRPLLLACLLLGACQAGSIPPDYGRLPLRSDSGALRVVIEIPAGTNDKREYDYRTNTFPVDLEDGRERVIAFLPYPGNYGFLPSTLMAKERGGDGDALDVLVLGPSAPTGTVVEVEAIAVLRLEDRGEADDKIIAVPLTPEARVIDASDLSELPSGAREIIERWFGSYKGPGKMRVIGWGDRAQAQALIERHRVASDGPR